MLQASPASSEFDTRGSQTFAPLAVDDDTRTCKHDAGNLDTEVIIRRCEFLRLN